ncbi:MAG: BamA/TamA family outer membrane protein [Gemmatimonadetes bacterium]|nr:BamA/TamA family outer membrane protein [Gemmatimonadota bacterium]
MKRQLLVLGVAVLAMADQTAAQARRDTVLVPGPEYRVGDWEETLLGNDYRDLWVTPMRVEYLDLATYGGGLRLIGRGGGRQTLSLRFRGGDGKQYAFRSVNKRPDLTNAPAFEGTLVGRIIQDQTSSLHPTGAVAVPTLVDAVNVPHVVPKLVVMPDDPRLGEFRAEFAGMLGTVEERPEDVEDEGGPFPPFGRVIGTVRLLERMEESAEDRVDAPTFLTARLLDMLLGDWDRHEDQWRWGELERGGRRIWVPIPRDRDYAFVDYDGLLLDLGRRVVRNIVEYTPNIRNVSGLTLNARGLDRRLLSPLDRAAWDSTVAFVQARITDAVIDSALQRIPPEHRGRTPEIVTSLRGRRADLRDAAAEYYELLSTEVDVRGTDDRDVALVDRTADGMVTVRLFDSNRSGETQGAAYFERSFTSRETNEIRIYLHGGDDRAIVRGDVPRSIMIRVVGGGGDDIMADSSVVRSGGTKAAFYDGRGDNVFVRGRATAAEDAEHSPPEPATDISGETYRDFGSRKGVAPVLGYSGIDGVILGVGRTYTRYGFWKEPYSYKLAARGMVGTRTGGVALEIEGDVRNTASTGGYSFLLRGSQLESIRFYGFGNETVDREGSRFYKLRQTQLLGWGTVNFGLPAGGRLAVGPVVKYTQPKVDPGTPFERENEYGSSFGQVGGLAEAEVDLRDNAAFPRNGARLAFGASAYPAMWDSEGFASSHATGSGYWTPSWRGAPTVALRAGGRKIWGAYPIHEAAFLGGSRSVRGYPTERFAGDAALFGNVEVRVPLGTANLGLVRGVLGVHGLADAGRVYLAGESSDEWHAGAGAGVWFRFTVRSATFATSVTFARGEDESYAYLKLGAPF